MLAACAPPSLEESGPLAQQSEGVVALASIDPERELFITDVSVVDDARYTTWMDKSAPAEGGWSFGRLIDNMVPELLRTPWGRSLFVLSWLRSWERDQRMNGQIVPARPLIRSLIIEPWRAASGCTGSDAHCVLDMAKAPFRLLAIVHRPDLRQVPTDGDPGQAGQGRFIFGALGPRGERLPFTLIFEYQLPLSEKLGMRGWGERWHELGSLPFGPAYNEKLFAVTRGFTQRDAAPGRVNGSALLQLRTNEVSLSSDEPKLWEMREFTLSSRTGLLRPVLVQQEVRASLNGTATLGAWAKEQAELILKGQHTVPGTWQRQPFQAAVAPVPKALSWSVPGVPEEVRSAFALATCSGCHKSETETNFLHVRPREPGSRSSLSAFLMQELSASGPRVADFHALLNTPAPEQARSGGGRDHGERRHDEQDE